MGGSAALRVVLVKPSKYGVDGCVERFRRGFMPNSTLPHLTSLTPASEAAPPARSERSTSTSRPTSTTCGSSRDAGTRTLVALVGVQSHQLHRALDLAAFALRNGVEGCVVGNFLWLCWALQVCLKRIYW